MITVDETLVLNFLQHKFKVGIQMPINICFLSILFKELVMKHEMLAITGKFKIIGVSAKIEK